jgi:hypothetical protein
MTKEQKCQYIKQLVPVAEKVGSTVKVVRYIPQEQERLDKHKQLKQRSLEQRKQRQSEIKDNRD